MIHYCTGTIVRIGRKYWGSPSGRPLCDPIPAEILEQHPDIIADWDNCDRCGRAVCGKVAHHVLRGDDGSEVWLCDEHWEEFMAQDENMRFAVWHECKQEE